MIKIRFFKWLLLAAILAVLLLKGLFFIRDIYYFHNGLPLYQQLDLTERYVSLQDLTEDAITLSILIAFALIIPKMIVAHATNIVDVLAKIGAALLALSATFYMVLTLFR